MTTFLHSSNLVIILYMLYVVDEARVRDCKPVRAVRGFLYGSRRIRQDIKLSDSHEEMHVIQESISLYFGIHLFSSIKCH